MFPVVVIIVLHLVHKVIVQVLGETNAFGDRSALGVVIGVFDISILIVSTGVYAARSLYYAVMESGRIPIVLTGTAVGLISVIGYTPDIFMGPLMGWLLDSNPGAIGHQYLFGVLALVSVLGVVFTLLFKQSKKLA